MRAGAAGLPRSYWVLAGLVLLYVALCTGQRDNHPRADAWEAHRAVLALSLDLWRPGNPTYAIDAPSVRYSPYSLLYAGVSRATGLDAYDVLSLACVLSTALFVFGIGALLRSFGEERSAAVGLLVCLGLFGETPAYSGSHALADLPWVGVSPALFAMGVTLWSWVLFRHFARRSWLAVGGVALLSAAAMLDHGMIGIFNQLALWIFALSSDRERRLGLCVRVFAIGIGTVVLCLAWPWFSLYEAVTLPYTPHGMLPPAILWQTVFVWTFPAALAGILALLHRRRPMVPVFLFAGYTCYLVGLAMVPLPEWVPNRPALARLPLPGLLFLQLALGVFAHQAGVFDPRTWSERLRRLTAGDARRSPEAMLEVLFTATFLYCLIPQLWTILDAPHVARAYVAPIVGKENQQLDLKDRFDALLASVGQRDVVLSDPDTSWAVPSSRGRIVFAIHPEWLAGDEPERLADVRSFFEADTPVAERLEILERRRVQWILLNREALSEAVFELLLRPSAVAASDGDLVLMRTDPWRAAGP